MINKLAFVNELSKLRPHSTFLTLKGYRSNSGEIADYSIVFNISYENALHRSIRALEAMKGLSNIEKLARDELIESFQSSLTKINTPSQPLNDGYHRFLDEDGEFISGIKLHIATNTLHLYGLIAHKRIIFQGTYPQTNRSELTIAKDKLRANTSAGKFRQFKIVSDQLDYISVDKLTLLPPDAIL